MAAGFEVPEGDPAAITAALQQLHTVASDLHTQQTSTKNAFAEALSTWKAPRADTFRNASAGIQVQVTSAESVVGNALIVLTAYAKALSSAQEEIRHLGTLADQRTTQAQTHTASMPPDSPQATQEWQHAEQYVAQLRSQATDLRTHLTTLAQQTAAAIDAGTDTALPGASKLTPAEVRTRVDHAYGVEGTQAALAQGRLGEDAAWGALDTPAKAVPEKDVKEDGEPDWKEILREENDKAVTAWAVGSAPPAGWALGQLARNYSAYRAAVAKLPTSFVDVVGPELDSGRLYLGVDDILGEVERSVQWTAGDEQAAGASFNLWKATEAAGEGGLPKGFMAGAGHVFSVLGAAADVMTIIDPGVENKTEGNVLRGTAAANLAGLGAVEFGGAAAAALGLDAAVGWVPVAGQVVVIATGLFLAGDWVYHNWDTVKGWGKDVGNFVTDTVPHALGDAAHATEHGLETATHAVGDVASDTVHGLGDAAKSVGSFLGL